MKKIALAVMVCAAVGILGACGTSDPTPGSPTTISAAEAKEIIDSGEAYILVDVRNPDEYAAARIDTAILIPVDSLAERAPSELPDKDARILVYCRSGVRATTAAGILADLGYTQVYNMGGINSWPYGTVS